MTPLRFAMFGTGFWSRFQLAGWQEVGGVECVALYNRTPSKARELAKHAGIGAQVYDDPVALLARERLDFVDVVTHPQTHVEMVALAASRGLPVVCQKPMAPSLGESEAMLQRCEAAGVSLFVNENWRWQEPIRRLRQVLTEGAIGDVYRARIRMVSGFPIFDNQPFLRRQPRFLLLDVGSHILDVARFLFGEAESVYCTTRQIQRNIEGEDVATVVLRCQSGATVVCELGYSGAPLEVDHFPQTFALVEGDRGSVELAPHYQLRITAKDGTRVVDATPPRFAWADPAYDVVHASIVPCQADLLAGLRGERAPETTGADNLKTMRLVHECYESALRNEVIRL